MLERVSSILPRVGEQLKLELGMPWDGVSPRYLTRAPKRLSLASERTTWPAEKLAQAIQLELFPEEKSFGTWAR